MQEIDWQSETRKVVAAAANGRERAAESAPADRCYLLVVEGGSSSIFYIPRNGEVIIGRSTDAQLQLHDGSVSRKHAKIVVSDGEATLVDLGSHNGTRVNGERVVSSRVLTSGDVVSICAVTLVFHRDARAPTRRPVFELLHLRQRLEEEIERSLRYQRPVTLLAIQLADSSAVDRSRVANAVVGHLRLLDVVAWGGEAQLLVLLPEIEGESVAVPSERLLRALAPVAPKARVGFATCPTDGCDVDTLLASARAAAKTAQVGKVAQAAEAASTMRVGDRTIVVADPAMVRLFALVERLASSDIPVLVCGETGVGKEIVATAVHYWSRRREGPLVAINCAALHDTLLESELFGFERGAFSGADATKPGRLESADGGTVFLDEIGELSASAQAKLLRVLETKRVSRLGAVREREIDVRIVAATNRSLEADVRAGRFRQDLFFRLTAATVVLPPLRDRKHELPILARSFLQEGCLRSGRTPMSLSSAVMQVMALYSWPGNVRELKNLIDFLVATCMDPVVQPVMLPDRMLEMVEVSRTDESNRANTADQPTSAPRPPAPGVSAGAPPIQATTVTSLGPGEEAAGTSFRNIYEEIRALEESRMRAALSACGGQRNRAAELIGMPLRTFVTKLKVYNITDSDPSRRGSSSSE